MTELARRKKLLVSQLMLGCGIIASLLASFNIKQNIEKNAFEQLTVSCDQTTLKIQDRLSSYAMILRGTASLFAASKTVSRYKWHAYISSLNIGQNAPGVQGIGFAQLIPQGQLAAHIAQVRAEGFPAYTVRPAGRSTSSTAIIYLEPFEGRNLRAFGYDMYSEFVRRSAMQQARDSGEAALSGRVILVQETEKAIQSGVLMYYPVYRNAAPLNTLEQRRSALTGWVYSPFRMNDLMAGTLTGLKDSKFQSLDLHIYDGSILSPEHLLFDSKLSRTASLKPAFKLQRLIQFDTNTLWLLEFDAIDLKSDYSHAWETLIAGLAISTLLFGLMRSIINTRARAAGIAAGLTSEIAELSQRFSLAADSARIGVWDYDIKQNRLVWDKWMYALYGISPKTFSGAYHAWQRGLHPDDRVRGDLEIKAALNGEHPFDTEFRVVWPGGQVHYIKAYAIVLRNAEGEALRMIGVNYDITEHKLSEAAQSLQTQQLSDIFALSPDGFVSFDASQQLNYASPAFFSLTGLSYDEITGINEAQFTLKMIALCIPSRSFRNLDGLACPDSMDVDKVSARELIELRSPKGRTLEVGLRLNRNCAVSKMLYFRDVTYENEVSRMKSEFLSTAAHELRTPMASIHGFTELLLSREFDKNKRDDLLMTIYQQSELMIKITNELLDLARIEAHREVDFVFALHDLPALVAEAVAGFKLAENRVPPVVTAPGTAAQVNVDRTKLLQVINNLISNAYKYSPEGGEVSIHYSHEFIDGKPMLGVKISDRGIGMTPAQTARVFKRFYRADPSGHIPGTGLGMSIVKEIIELHTGHVKIDSVFGQGTSVTILLPEALA